MGGVGKTQIAVEYIYRHKGDYDGIYWISASDQPEVALLFGFQKIASTVDCVENAGALKPTEVADEVHTWLGSRSKWRLKLDNG